MSDTSEMNRQIGLSPVEFREVDGRSYGKNTLSGFVQEWEEVPWRWEYLRTIVSERIYSRGLTTYGRGIFHLEPGLLHVYFGFVPSHFLGRLILLFARPIFRSRYTRVIRDYEEKVLASPVGRGKGFSLLELQPIQYDNLYLQRDKNQSVTPMDRLKVQQIREKMGLKNHLNQEIVDRFFAFILSANSTDLYRIRPRKLAEELGEDLDSILAIILHSTREGLVNMSWDIICPHCQGIRERASHLWEVNQRATCDVCKIDFDAGDINGIEISFHINSTISPLDKVLYCSAEPAKKPHIKYQNLLYPGVVHMLNLPLPNGRYRLRTLGQKKFNLLDIAPNHPEKNLLWVGDQTGLSLDMQSQGTLEIRNPGPESRTFVIEEDVEDRYALRPRDLFANQEFHDLFSQESLSTDLSIDVGVQNLVFMDVVGSTEVYGQVGNSRAFAYIREYFKVSHDLALQYSGAIVKTMGDAIFFTFPDALTALKASVALQTYFNGSRPEVPLGTRITINRGPCVAVNLNTGIDYFGQAVNVVGKLQSFTDKGEIALTGDVVEDRPVAEYLKSRGFSLTQPLLAEVKGVGTIPYWKLS